MSMLNVRVGLLKFRNFGIVAANKMSSSSETSCFRLKGKVSVVSASTEGYVNDIQSRY